MNIKILGNGGFVNNGLPYIAFMIGENTLVETPPDIMHSLTREGIDVMGIDEIYLSHTHGDHSFGFPFLILRIFLECVVQRREKRLTLFAPQDAKEYLITLTEMAVSKGHPVIAWIERNVDFITIGDSESIDLAGLTARLYEMDHFEETLAFVLSDGKDNVFSYTADTKWSEPIETLLRARPKKILADMNGEPEDPVQVHLREDEVIKKGLPIVGPNAIFYGTHLKKQKESPHPRLIYVTPGMEIAL